MKLKLLDKFNPYKAKLDKVGYYKQTRPKMLHEYFYSFSVVRFKVIAPVCTTQALKPQGYNVSD